MENLLKVTSRMYKTVNKLTPQLPVDHWVRQFSTKTKKPDLRKFCFKNPKEISDPHLLKVAKQISEFECRQRVQLGKYLRVVDESVARQFAKMIMSTPAVNASYVIELNAGLGFLTRELLKAGVPTIHVFEQMKYFTPKLNSIVNKYEGRVHWKRMTFDHLWHMDYNDWLEDTNKLPEFLQGLEERKWEDDPVFHIIGADTKKTLISCLITSIIFRNSLSKYGRTVLHLALPPSVWVTLSCDNQNYRLYQWRAILFQTLFRYEFVGTLSREAFLPQYPKTRLRKNAKNPKVRVHRTRHYADAHTLCVIRMEVRNDLHKDGLTAEDIVPFFFFVRHLFKKRTNRIIAEMEKWVPGCGRSLIAAGFTVVSKFGELLPHEVVKLFLLFKSWPEYEKSTFMTMMDTFPSRMDEQITFGTTSDKVDEMFKSSRESTNRQAESDEFQ